MIDICVLTAGARPDLLQLCLDSVYDTLNETKTSAKVYLLNNGGDDRRTNPGVVHPVLDGIKRLPKNGGYPIGANTAINMGRNELVLFLSDDIVIGKDTIQSLMQTMKGQTIGLCGLKLLFPHNSTDKSRPAGTVQHVGHTVDLHGNVIHPFIGWSAQNPKVCKSGEVFSVTGAAFMIRRKVWNAVRGFDVGYGLGTYEDVDLALKIRRLGYKIYLDANAIAEHYVGATAEALRQPFPLNENKALFLSRWKQSGLFVWDEWVRY